ncbi:3-oxoacyl-ACP synthase III [Desulforhopalus singaporensis]|uniref:3-oxoacyl-[acyl-carrier-protein] synthase-3 n=1 Tax=Desulforhopalus singaporensis TaxID=91360 RepID=A0A1H0V979_9BACT|nr:3-oxoacyl-ACP synthase III [Desulforhopalus singaporensis]SDP75129.1 3-oxoacyl-[acyl-carrier-protein] synthase-3 [Desulforhopalus singaporensis]
MIDYKKVCLDTFGYELPPRVVTSGEIEERLEDVYLRLRLPKGRLELMSGISSRRLWPQGTTPSQAATLAGQRVIEKAAIDPGDIDCLLFTSVSRDMMEPATASFVHNNLGLSEKALIFDISNACLGFLDGMVMLANMIELGQVENGLIVSGETAEELLESTIRKLVLDTTLNRKTIKPAFASLTIGSGAVGLFMRRAGDNENRPRLVHGAWRANTRHSDLCHGGQTGTDTTLMATNSEELLRQGVETARRTWQQFSAKQGWEGHSIDRFFCHQVGSAHARLLFDTLELPAEKNFETLAGLGNVGSVSAPVTMAVAMEQQAFLPGQKGALLGIGSGINCMMLGVEWQR